MGIWERPPQNFLDALQQEFGFDPPREHGLDTVDSIRALRDGKAHVFIGLGGNFVQAAPDTEVVDRGDAPGPADRAHLDQAEPLAPGLRRDGADPADQGPDREGHPGQRPAVDLRGGLDLLGARLPRAAGAGQSASCGRRWRSSAGSPRPRSGTGTASTGRRMRDDYSVIRQHIARVVPGCETYEVNVRRPGGFVMPHPPRDTRTFATKSGRAEFVVSPIEVLQVPAGHLVLQTLRSHDQFNTTIYGLSDRYRGIEGGRRVVFVHPDDIAAAGLRRRARSSTS